MKRARSLAASALALAALLSTTLAAHGKGNNCSFQSRGLSMNFGVLNPASERDATMAVSAAALHANKVGDCAPGQSLSISGDNGLHFNGSRRLKNTAGTDFITYSLALPWTSQGPGNGTFVNFTFKGTILWSAYANASAGSYTDTLMILVTP